MGKNPKISIIIPVYNTEQYLRAAVESVINQTYENKEIILVDDGSTDSSPKICDEYASTYAYIKVIHQTNAGLSAARNAGIENSTGDYIAFLDSDDEYGDKNMIAYYAGIFMQNPSLDLIQFPTIWYWNENKFSISGQVKEILNGNIKIGQHFSSDVITRTACDKIYNKQIFNIANFAVGRYFEDVWFMTDIIPFLNNVLIDNFGSYKYKIREGSITQSKYTLIKCKQKIETQLKFIRILINYNKNTYNHINNFIHLQDKFLRFNLERNSNDFLCFHKQIMETIPNVYGIIRYSKSFSINKIIQIMLTKAFGIKLSILFYNLKNGCASKRPT